MVDQAMYWAVAIARSPIPFHGPFLRMSSALNGEFNPLAETINGLYKADGIRATIFHTGLYQTIADVEYATAGWVGWYNNRRLHGNLCSVRPIKYEHVHYAALTEQFQPALKRQDTGGASTWTAPQARSGELMKIEASLNIGPLVPIAGSVSRLHRPRVASSGG